MIAIVPAGLAKANIDAIRTKIAVEYFTTRALLNPAHITLVPPFYATDNQVSNLTTGFIEVLKFQNAFNIKLSRYSFFKQNRVAFLDVDIPNPLAAIHTMLKGVFEALEPTIKFMAMAQYQPHVTLAYKDITPVQFTMMQINLLNKKESIDWKVDSIEIWIRVDRKWLVHDTLVLNPDSFTRTIKAGINEFKFTFQPVHSEELNELYYIVTYQDIDFIMKYDNDALQFKVEGAAPYDARMLENELANVIEDNDN